MAAFWAHDATPYGEVVMSLDESCFVDLDEPPAVGAVLAHPQREGRLLIRVEWVTPETKEFGFVQVKPDATTTQMADSARSASP